MPITVTYINQDINEYYITIDKISNINFRFNDLTFHSTNMNFPSLTEFDCSENKLTLLPNNMNFPSLTKFYCNNNKLTTLPDNMNFPNLQDFH